MQELFVRSEKNRKAGPLMTSTLALIIFAIMVAVIFIIFWDLESGSVSKAFSDFLAGENVEELVDDCNNFANKRAYYNYCCVERKVKHNEDGEKIVDRMTCEKLQRADFVNGRIKKISCGEFQC